MSKLASFRNWGFDLVRATEAAACVAGRWMGIGKRDEADLAATEAMAQSLGMLEFDGRIVIGEEEKLATRTLLETNCQVGTGQGPAMDVVVDPIDGRRLLVQGRPGAVAIAAASPRGTMWSPKPAIYMEKIVVAREARDSLVTECMDAPAAWTLALIARIKQKAVRDLIVFVLDRPRHAELIEEIRLAGARVMLRSDGDAAGALMAASPDSKVDILMGIGGVPEGMVAACGVKALGGAMLGRLAPQSAVEQIAVKEAGLDTRQILTCDQLISSDRVFFAATGITDGPLLEGVRYRGNQAQTQSLVLRSDTGTRRFIMAEHVLDLEE